MSCAQGRSRTIHHDGHRIIREQGFKDFAAIVQHQVSENTIVLVKRSVLCREKQFLKMYKNGGLLTTSFVDDYWSVHQIDANTSDKNPRFVN